MFSIKLVSFHQENCYLRRLMDVGKLFKMLVFEWKTGQGPKDTPLEDICSTQSLKPQSFYFLLIFRVYKGEIQTHGSDKVKSAESI